MNFSLEMTSFAAFFAKRDKIRGQFALASPTPNSEGLDPFSLVVYVHAVALYALREVDVLVR